jgi:peptidoglycan/xylan/chitin deacetylase (PgdA/CDA1 family)
MTTPTAASLPTQPATATFTATDLPAAALPATPERATSTPTAQITPTPALVMQGPGKIICPILLYHHVAKSDTNSPYYVPPEEFRAQMQALKDWGYTPIPVTLLVKAINFGADLPARPVVISFDDGDASVYSAAFPIMKEFGFTGTNYIVVNYVNQEGFMSVDQLKELAAAGWETGSHSMTHADLTQSKRVEWEVVQSRHSLEKLLGVPVETFAYPYGLKNAFTLDLVKDNYRAGMGLGAILGQEPGNLFYLWRRPVKPGWDLQTFGSFLPWNTP